MRLRRGGWSPEQAPRARRAPRQRCLSAHRGLDWASTLHHAQKQVWTHRPGHARWSYGLPGVSLQGLGLGDCRCGGSIEVGEEGGMSGIVSIRHLCCRRCHQNVNGQSQKGKATMSHRSWEELTKVGKLCSPLGRLNPISSTRLRGQALGSDGRWGRALCGEGPVPLLPCVDPQRPLSARTGPRRSPGPLAPWPWVFQPSGVQAVNFSCS